MGKTREIPQAVVLRTGEGLTRVVTDSCVVSIDENGSRVIELLNEGYKKNVENGVLAYIARICSGEIEDRVLEITYLSPKKRER